MNGQNLASKLLKNEDFAKSYDNCQFWRGSIPQCQLKELFSWEHLNHALSTSRITNDRLRLSVKDGYELPNKQAFRPVKDRFGRPTDSLSMSELHRLMSEGVTGVLEATNELFPDIGIFTEALSNQYYARSTANAYFSFGSTSGFGPHNDDHDVIVLQIEGKKKWRFFGTSSVQSMATVDHLRDPTETDVAEEIVLVEGEILFIPKGTWHDVVALNEPSLHLTVSIVYPTVFDYAQWLLDQHRYSLPYRDIKLFGGDLEPISKDCATFFEAIINKETLATFLESYYARHAALRIRPSFPSLNHVSLEENFRKVPFTFINLGNSKNDATIEYSVSSLGRKHILNQSEHQLLTHLSHDHPMSGSDLVTSLGNDKGAWMKISAALESLLDRGLISKIHESAH